MEASLKGLRLGFVLLLFCSIHQLLDEKSIYESNLAVMVDKAKSWLTSDRKVDDVIELMNIVKEKHTYVNRIESILNCLAEHKTHSQEKRVHYDKFTFHAKSLRYRFKQFKRRYLGRK
ncbi:hypothetical protein [Agaribacterium sp. ZY112]|uniref:hypothetical protein n=1 Tax=Agaribacterium sp. ZY112 TaxID=3233574 RepID=UPI00352633D1